MKQEMSAQEYSSENKYIPFRDQISQDGILALVVAAGFLYGYVYSGWFIFLYSLLAPLFLWIYTGTELHDPLILDRSFDSPLTEIAIVLLVFFDSVFALAIILAPSGVLTSFLIPLLIVTLFNLVFFLFYRRYSRKSLGLTLEGFRFGRDFLTVFIIAGIGISFLRILIDYPTYLISDLGLLIQIVLSALFIFSIPVAFTEELVFRAIVQPRLTSYLNSRIGGIAITSLIFAGAHIFTVQSSLGIMQGDMLFAFLTALLTRLPLSIVIGMVWDMTRSLAAPFLIHTVNNTLYYLVYAITLLGA